MDAVARKLKLAAWLAQARGDVRRWYSPHPKQRDFHRAGTMARERLFLAGNRVGKTLAGACEMAFHLTGDYPDWWDGVRFDKPVEAWAASVTREATRDILQAVYLGEAGRDGVIGNHRIAGMTMKGGVAGAVDVVKVRHARGGVSVLGFKSYDQGRASFQGTARDIIHLDEEPDIDVYEECLLRTLTVRGHVMLTMTPLLGLSEMVRHFTDHERGGGKAVVRAGWKDAVHLDTATVDGLRKSLRPHEVMAREFGEPSVGKGRVYPIEERDVKVPRFEIPPHYRRCVGVDFGWSNPTAAVWLAEDPESGIAYVTDIYFASERVPGEHAGEILRRGHVPAVCDPAGQALGQKDGVSLVEMYAVAGLRFELADNGVEAGLMRVLELMRSGRLRVFDDLDGWWREFRLYHRDGKGRVVKRDDHLMDATRYAVVSGLPIARAEGAAGTLVRKRLRRGDGWTL